jgi:hypothetical protein
MKADPEATLIRASQRADDEPLALDPRDTKRVLHDYHSPLPWINEGHHVIPQSWTKALGMPHSRLIPACPTGHDALHAAIRAAIAGVEPIRIVDEKVKPYVDEAVLFWQEHEHELTGMRPALSELTD